MVPLSELHSRRELSLLNERLTIFTYSVPLRNSFVNSNVSRLKIRIREPFLEQVAIYV